MVSLTGTIDAVSLAMIWTGYGTTVIKKSFLKFLLSKKCSKVPKNLSCLSISTHTPKRKAPSCTDAPSKPIPFFADKYLFYLWKTYHPLTTFSVTFQSAIDKGKELQEWIFLKSSAFHWATRCNTLFAVHWRKSIILLCLIISKSAKS